MKSENNQKAIIAFPSAAAAARLIAGVPAAARAVRKLADEGASSILLRLGAESTLAPETLAEVDRLRGHARVTVEAGEGPRLRLPGAWEIVRATGKPGDGLVSRWLNRPISQRITWLMLLAMPGVRPLHVTLLSPLLAALMLACLLSMTPTGLIVGAILYQVASVLDGVDGEIARATWRTSADGAALDSLIDMGINFLFVLGLTVHLAVRDQDAIGWIGGLAIVQMLAGTALIARRVRAEGRPLGFDYYKRRAEPRGGVFDLAYQVVQVLTGRDCFAFLFMVLTIVGLERVALAIFTGVGTVWLVYIAISALLPVPRARRGAA